MADVPCVELGLGSQHLDHLQIRGKGICIAAVMRPTHQGIIT